jgi:hypothetical protein
MQFSGSDDAGTSRESGDSQLPEGQDDALVAVMEDDDRDSPADGSTQQPAAKARRAKSTDHPEVFTVDLLGSWFKP